MTAFGPKRSFRFAAPPRLPRQVIKGQYSQENGGLGEQTFPLLRESQRWRGRVWLDYLLESSMAFRRQRLH
jgi:hypothetical protein